MIKSTVKVVRQLTILILVILSFSSLAQNTQIKGFVAAGIMFENDELSFGIGEQDLFIVSQLNDDFSFLGETVFKYSPNSPTSFNVSVERIIVTYNFTGNHNALIGKHHTPTNYWNDTYHHGRVFFPTIDRPLMFAAHIFPIHTTGLALNGLNLGNLRFGYNFMLGNGIGSNDVSDNDAYKSVTAGVHIKPNEKLQIGVSFYNDKISAGAVDHGQTFSEDIDQQLFTASIINFGRKLEFLGEITFASNKAESTGSAKSLASYAYAGWRVNDKFVPYLRYDYLSYDDNEIYYAKDDTSSFVFGARYEVSYLIVLKMEYQRIDSEVSGIRDMISAQVAIGF